MTRTELSKLGNAHRHTFFAEFVRYGSKVNNYTGDMEDTILFRDVKLASTGKIVCDHIWFTMGIQFENLGELKTGDVVRFDARVDEYIKGYRGRRAEESGEDWTQTDWKLSRPTKIKKIGLRLEPKYGTNCKEADDNEGWYVDVEER